MQKYKIKCKYCNVIFETIRKYQVFCSKQCVWDNRKVKYWTVSGCMNCKNIFEHRKSSKRMFCSSECMRSSDYKKSKLRKQMQLNNPMHRDSIKKKHKKSMNSKSYKELQRKLSTGRTHSYKSIQKMSKIKKQQYKENGKEILAKRDKTYLKKYGMKCGEYFSIKGKEYAENIGVSNIFQTPDNILKSKNRISKPQKLLYNQIKKDNDDAILECFLDDIKRNVDIFVPSQNKVIELYGDYWHANPKKYDGDYFNDLIKLTAQEIWERDRKREREIIEAGYKLKIIWECDIMEIS